MGSVTRSPGRLITIGGAMGIVGGGYEGASTKLDRAVELVAKLLKEAFGGSVEIRFNSNRMSGGAFLVDGPLCNMNYNDKVGVNVHLSKQKKGRRLFEKLGYCIYVSRAALREGAVDGTEKNPAVKIRGPRSAIRWIERNVTEAYTTKRKVSRPRKNKTSM